VATIRSVERTIAKVEGFRANFLHPDGRDVRGDKQELPPYRFERGAKDEFTVAHWRAARFRRRYPGYDAEVLYGDGTIAHGRTKLATVRASYR
jgi:hypothetical protein